MADTAPALEAEPPPPLYAMTRTRTIEDFSDLRAASRHAGRVDVSSWLAARPGCDYAQRAMAWSCDREHPEDTNKRCWSWVSHDPGPPQFDENKRPIYPAPPDDWTPPAGCDYEAAWRACRKQQKARDPKKGAPIGFHTLAMVSPAYLSEAAGDPDELERRRDLLIDQAVAWARDTFGQDSVAAWRYDRDERGSAVVDLILVPVEKLSLGGREKKPTISTNRALERLAVAEGMAKYRGYAAMQESWARWAQAHIDPRLERGTSKIETGREHLPADEVREDYERQRRAAETELRAALERRDEVQAALTKLEPRLAAIRSDLREARDQRGVARRESAAATTERRALQDDLAALGPQLVTARTDLAEARRQRDLAHEERAAARADLVELQPVLAAARQEAETHRADLPALRQEAAALRAELPELRADCDDARAKRKEAIEKRRRSVDWGRESARFAARTAAEVKRVTGWLDSLHDWLHGLAQGGAIWDSIVEAIGEPPEDPRRPRPDPEAPDEDLTPSGGPS